MSIKINFYNQSTFLFIWNTSILVFFIFIRFVKSLPESIDLIVRSLQVIESFKNNITDPNKTIPRALTGAHGFISTKSLESLELTLWTLQRLWTILWGFEYENTDMLSLMMLAIEHFHATTHLKSPLMSQLQYSRTFMMSITESIKRACTWSAHY